MFDQLTLFPELHRPVQPVGLESDEEILARYRADIEEDERYLQRMRRLKFLRAVAQDQQADPVIAGLGIR